MLTKEQRELLVHARALIESGKEEFLCIALKDGAIVLGEADYWPHYESLRAYIERSIAPYTVLDTWQSNNGFSSRSDEHSCNDRLAWIDWLLDDWIIHDGDPKEPVGVTHIRFRRGDEYRVWPGQFYWFHVGEDHPMRGSDIVAYKLMP